MNTISFYVVSTYSNKDFLVNVEYKDKQFK